MEVLNSSWLVLSNAAWRHDHPTAASFLLLFYAEEEKSLPVKSHLKFWPTWCNHTSTHTAYSSLLTQVRDLINVESKSIIEGILFKCIYSIKLLVKNLIYHASITGLLVHGRVFEYDACIMHKWLFTSLVAKAVLEVLSTTWYVALSQAWNFVCFYMRIFFRFYLRWRSTTRSRCIDTHRNIFYIVVIREFDYIHHQLST